PRSIRRSRSRPDGGGGDWLRAGRVRRSGVECVGHSLALVRVDARQKSDEARGFDQRAFALDRLRLRAVHVLGAFPLCVRCGARRGVGVEMDLEHGIQADLDDERLPPERWVLGLPGGVHLWREACPLQAIHHGAFRPHARGWTAACALRASRRGWGRSRVAGCRCIRPAACNDNTEREPALHAIAAGAPLKLAINAWPLPRARRRQRKTPAITRRIALVVARDTDSPLLLVRSK